MSDTIQTPVETLKKSTNEVAVVALADGGFIRFFLDEDDELRAQRFDAQGNPVGEIFVVAQEAGPEVTAEMLESGQIEVSFETASGAMETSLVPIEQNLIEGSDDDDDLLGTAGDDKILGLAGDDILDGAAGDDEIRGSTGDDEIRGRAGDDELRGGKGNDDVRGGAGDDVVRSGAGDDVLSGGAGDDFMMAGAGDDEMDGGAGNDEMRAGQGDDIMDGGAGDDEMRASGGDDQMSGGAGHDVMRGAAGADRMLGGNGDDMMAGGQGADIIRGGAGNDHVVADTQDAALAGGQDSNADEASIENGDTLDLSKASEGVFVDLDVNFAGVSAPGLSQEGAVRNIGVVDGGEETFNISADDFENVIGTEFDDRIFGNAEANVLEGRGGDDVFHAFGGTDIYDGGEGTDTALFAQAIGGIDADLAAGVVLAPLTEGEDAKEEGVETEVNTLISIENLTGGIGDDVIAGSDVANVLQGGSGDDELLGRDGDDTLVGNLGDDRMIGGDGDDLMVWNNGDGSDFIDGGADDDRMQVNFQQSSDLSDLDLQNDDVAEINTGNNGFQFNRVEVNGQSEVGLFQLDIENTETLEVNFGGGTDTARILSTADLSGTIELDGGTGTDTLDLSDLFAFSSTEVDLGTGEIVSIDGGESDDTAINFENFIGTNQDDTVRGSDETNVIDGRQGSDNLSGLGGDDTLNGGQGDDTLTGNLGDDRMIGGDGDDLMVWNNGDGSDFIDGGADDDRMQVNFQQSSDLSDLDLQNDDEALVTFSEAGIQFNRTAVNGQSEVGLFQLDIENAETLEVNFGGGDDISRFAGIPQEAFILEFDGGDGIDTLDFSQVELGEELVGVVLDLESGGPAVGPEEILGENFGGVAQLEPIVIEEELPESKGFAINFENVIGSVAEDFIVGTDGANNLQGFSGDDDLFGEGGDDTLVGNLGDDRMIGGDGDDLMVWNNGDGSDFIDGGADDDRMQVNFQQSSDLSDLDLQNDDVAEFSNGNNGGVQFNRVEVNGQSEVGLFQLDIEKTETLEVNFGGGTDTARLLDTADLRTTLELDGGNGVDTIDFSSLSNLRLLELSVAVEVEGGGVPSGITFDLGSGVIESVFRQASDDTAVNFENVIGTAEDDIFKGNAEVNIFEGGEGADTFVFAEGSNADVVTDFDVSADAMDVSELGLTAEDALALAVQVGTVVDGDTLVDFGNGDSVLLEDVFVEDLSVDNFIGLV